MQLTENHTSGMGLFQNRTYHIMNNEFSPKKSLLERYSRQSLTNEDKQRLDELSRTKKDLLRKYLDKGFTQEQAETTAMRIMYIPGFSGPTFKD